VVLWKTLSTGLRDRKNPVDKSQNLSTAAVDKKSACFKALRRLSTEKIPTA